MQDLTDTETWDGSYLEKSHRERMLRKIQRECKRYTRLETRSGLHVQHMCVNFRVALQRPSDRETPWVLRMSKSVLRMWMSSAVFISCSLYAYRKVQLEALSWALGI
jgi:hypothetical protein